MSRSGGERVLALIHRLVPPSRRRRLDGAEALYRAWVGSAKDPAERRRRSREAVRDAFRVLVASWAEVTWSMGRWWISRGGGVVDAIRKFLKNGWRGVRRRPVQSAVVVLTIGVAIGANTTLFSVGHALLLRQLPYENAADVVVVQRGSVVSLLTGPGGATRLAVDREFTELDGVEDAAWYLSHGSGNLTVDGSVRRVRVAQTSPNFLDVLGVNSILGGGMDPSSHDRVAVLGHAVWRQDYGASTDVIGRLLIVNGVSYEIVGVAPPEVRFPEDTEAWLTGSVQRDLYPSAFGGEAIARLAPGTDRQRAETELGALLAEEARAWAEDGYVIPPPMLTPLHEFLVNDVRGPLVLLIGAALLVFVLGGLNLTGVWVNDSIERASELSMRRALGASRRAIYGQLVSETLCVSLIGGVVAVALAEVTSMAVAARLPAGLPGLDAIGTGPGTLLVGLALSVTIGVGFGSISAARAIRLERGVSSRPGITSGTRRLQGALATGQGALALVLVVSAALTVRSFQNLAVTPLGFESTDALSFRVRLASETTPDRDSQRAYVTELKRRLLAIPGVTRVGATNSLPLTNEMGIIMMTRADESAQTASTIRLDADADYFGAAGIRFVDGGPFRRGEHPDEGVVLDAEMARAVFGEEKVAGRMMEWRNYVDGEEVWERVEVRGVVEAVSTRGVRVGVRPTTYWNLERGSVMGLGFVVSHQAGSARLVDAVRRAALETDPSIAPFGIRTLGDAAAEQIAIDRALATVSSTFSAFALLLAALGLYGLVAQQISRRRQEFGLRLALGARPDRLVRSVTREGVTLGITSVAVGLPVALVVARELDSRLFGVPSWDIVSFGVGCLLLVGACSAAAWLPARRIVRVDPREALSAQ